jgi:hypothetical protein
MSSPGDTSMLSRLNDGDVVVELRLKEVNTSLRSCSQPDQSRNGAKQSFFRTQRPLFPEASICIPGGRPVSPLLLADWTATRARGPLANIDRYLHQQPAPMRPSYCSISPIAAWLMLGEEMASGAASSTTACLVRAVFPFCEQRRVRSTICIM